MNSPGITFISSSDDECGTSASQESDFIEKHSDDETTSETQTIDFDENQTDQMIGHVFQFKADSIPAPTEPEKDQSNEFSTSRATGQTSVKMRKGRRSTLSLTASQNVSGKGKDKDMIQESFLWTTVNPQMDLEKFDAIKPNSFSCSKEDSPMNDPKKNPKVEKSQIDQKNKDVVRRKDDLMEKGTTNEPSPPSTMKGFSNEITMSRFVKCPSLKFMNNVSSSEVSDGPLDVIAKAKPKIRNSKKAKPSMVFTHFNVSGFVKEKDEKEYRSFGEQLIRLQKGDAFDSLSLNGEKIVAIVASDKVKQSRSEIITSKFFMIWNLPPQIQIYDMTTRGTGVCRIMNRSVLHVYEIDSFSTKKGELLSSTFVQDVTVPDEKKPGVNTSEANFVSGLFFKMWNLPAKIIIRDDRNVGAGLMVMTNM
jgi:hypothetical protein